MQNLLIFLICINIFLIVFLFFGVTNIFKENVNPKTRAYYSVFLSILMFLYLASIIAAGISYLFLAKYSASPVLFIFLIFPFAIGNFASYNKIQMFTYLQIFVFLLSLIYLIYLYINY